MMTATLKCSIIPFLLCISCIYKYLCMKRIVISNTTFECMCDKKWERQRFLKNMIELKTSIPIYLVLSVLMHNLLMHFNLMFYSNVCCKFFRVRFRICALFYCDFPQGFKWIWTSLMLMKCIGIFFCTFT